MPIHRWADDFDARLRFGIPTLPITRRSVVPKLVQLPPRAGAFRYSDDDVAEILNLLTQVTAGQAVALQDDPEESENKARRKCQILREQVESMPPAEDGTPVIDAEWYLRGHSIGTGAADAEGNFPAYMPAVSLAKRRADGTAPEADAAVAEPDAEPAAEPEPDAAPEPEPEPETPRRRRRQS